SRYSKSEPAYQVCGTAPDRIKMRRLVSLGKGVDVDRAFVNAVLSRQRRHESVNPEERHCALVLDVSLVPFKEDRTLGRQHRQQRWQQCGLLTFDVELEEESFRSQF